MTADALATLEASASESVVLASKTRVFRPRYE